jgi:hypothetical protein
MADDSNPCPSCGKTSEAGSLFCGHCGATMEGELFSGQKSDIPTLGADKAPKTPAPQINIPQPPKNSGLDLDFDDYDAPEVPMASAPKVAKPAGVTPGGLGATGVRPISSSTSDKKRSGGGGLSKLVGILVLGGLAVVGWLALSGETELPGLTAMTESPSGGEGAAGEERAAGEETPRSAKVASPSSGIPGAKGAPGAPAGQKGAGMVSVQRGQGNLTEAEAVEQVNQLLGKNITQELEKKAAVQKQKRSNVIEIPPDATIEEEIAALESRVNSNPNNSQDVATYLEEMAKNSKSDGSAELAAMDRLLDDTQKEAPEETAEARAALAAFGDNPEAMIADLEAQMKEMPENQTVRKALAEAKVQVSPEEALEHLSNMEGADVEHLRGEALFKMGDAKSAIQKMAAANVSDAESKLNRLKALSRAGQCLKGEKLAEEMLETGGYAYGYDWILYQAVCLMNKEKAWNMGQALMAKQGVHPNVRKRLQGLMALLAFWFGYEDLGREYCKAFSRTRANDMKGYEIRLRCALAAGKLQKQKRIYIGPKDTGKLLLLKSAWVYSKTRKAPPRFAELPKWDPGVSLLHLMMRKDLKRNSGDALTQVRGAFVAPRWLGDWDVPLTGFEILNLAKMASRQNRPFVLSGANVLIGNRNGFDLAREELPSSMTRLLALLIQYRVGVDVEAVYPAARALKGNALASYLAASTTKNKKEAIEVFRSLLEDKQIGPYAFSALRLRKVNLDTWEKENRHQFADHPAFLSGQIW